MGGKGGVLREKGERAVKVNEFCCSKSQSYLLSPLFLSPSEVRLSRGSKRCFRE